MDPTTAWSLIITVSPETVTATVRRGDAAVPVVFGSDGTVLPSQVILGSGQERSRVGAEAKSDPGNARYVDNPFALLGRGNTTVSGTVFRATAAASILLMVVHHFAVRTAGGGAPSEVTIIHPDEMGSAAVTDLTTAATEAGFPAEAIRTIRQSSAHLPLTTPVAPEHAQPNTGSGSTPVTPTRLNDRKPLQWLVGAVIGIAGLGGLTAAIAIANQTPGSPPQPPSVSVSTDPDPPVVADPDPPVVADPDPPVVADPDPPATTLDCWDGSTSTSDEGCPPLAGEEALYWVVDTGDAICETFPTANFTPGTPLNTIRCDWSDLPGTYMFVAHYATSVESTWDNYLAADEELSKSTWSVGGFIAGPYWESTDLQSDGTTDWEIVAAYTDYPIVIDFVSFSEQGATEAANHIAWERVARVTPQEVREALDTISGGNTP